MRLGSTIFGNSNVSFHGMTNCSVLCSVIPLWRLAGCLYAKLKNNWSLQVKNSSCKLARVPKFCVGSERRSTFRSKCIRTWTCCFMILVCEHRRFQEKHFALLCYYVCHYFDGEWQSRRQWRYLTYSRYAIKFYECVLFAWKNYISRISRTVEQVLN